ncbi:hypothetical protein ALQ52_04445 [Pseudomonas cannabina pv. alisalensis]|nr:hypothetical protein ALQ52_04445 [Pseudomonas cannabina pv. alisalensis]
MGSALPVRTRVERSAVSQLLPERPRRLVGLFGHDDLQLRVQIAALAILVHQAITLDSQALTVLTVGPDGQVEPAGQGRHRHFGAQRRFPRGQRHGDHQIMAFDLEHRMRCKPDDQVQIPAGTATDTRCALALETNALAVDHARWNLHVQGLGDIAHALAVGAVLRHLETDLLGLPGQRFLEEHRQLHFHVLTLASRIAGASALLRPTTENGTEELGKVRRLFKTASTRPRTALPARRGLERTALSTVLAQFIVLGALVRAAEHLVGFGRFLEFVFGAGLLADVGMVLAGQLAVGGLDRLVVRSGLNVKYLVVVFEIHVTITYPIYPAKPDTLASRAQLPLSKRHLDYLTSKNVQIDSRVFRRVELSTTWSTENPFKIGGNRPQFKPWAQIQPGKYKRRVALRNLRALT